VCYWREGDFETAFAVAHEAFQRSTVGTSQRLTLINTLAMLAIQQGHLKNASDLLSLHAEEARYVDAPYAQAIFHSHLGFVSKRRGEESQDKDERAALLDLALIEYDGACALFEEMGHGRSTARTKNNIAMVLIANGMPERAHPYIQEAITIAKSLKDVSMLGSFEETRARALISEGKLREALVAISTSWSYLKGGEELALQSETQTTRGIILARIGKVAEAEEAFTLATELAETAQIGTVKIRLTCLREMMDFHKTEALRYEKEWVELALDTVGGHPSNAAKLLGISHQSCIKKIDRFALNKERTPVHTRNKKSRGRKTV
jgi:tetratricopeptide (TPR) repeat protein